MLNVTHTQAFALAVLITTALHGSMLWKMDDMAVEGASRQSQATSPAPRRHITLPPVVIIGSLPASLSHTELV